MNSKPTEEGYWEPSSNDQGEWEPLSIHLKDVAQRCASFTEVWGRSEEGRWHLASTRDVDGTQSLWPLLKVMLNNHPRTKGVMF